MLIKVDTKDNGSIWFTPDSSTRTEHFRITPGDVWRAVLTTGGRVKDREMFTLYEGLDEAAARNAAEYAASIISAELQREVEMWRSPIHAEKEAADVAVQ